MQVANVPWTNDWGTALLKCKLSASKGIQHMKVVSKSAMSDRNNTSNPRASLI
jgi:hypothetical protein